MNIQIFTRKLRVVFLEKFAVNRHHQLVAVLVDQAVGAIRVDCLYYERSFPFWLELVFFLGVQHHRSPDGQNQVAFLKASVFNLLVEGTGDAGLIHLDVLLGRQYFFVQCLELFETSLMTFFSSHPCHECDPQRWNLNL